MAELSIRTQEIKEHADVPSSEGLIIGLETSLLYRLEPDRAAEVFQKIGPRYVDIVVIPNLRSVIRAVTAAHTANALYSEGREQVAQQMLDQLKPILEARGVMVENVLLRDIKLPDTLRAAIEAKQQAEQQARRCSSCCSASARRPSASASRRRASPTSSASSPPASARSCCEWKGIEATEKLVNSPNSKIVVIGTRKNGLPLIRAVTATLAHVPCHRGQTPCYQVTRMR